MEFLNKKRGSFLIKSVLAGALIVASLQVNLFTASATQTKSESLLTFENYVSQSTELTDVELHQILLEEVKGALAEDGSLISVTQAEIDLENTKLMSTESENQTYHSIVIPLSTIGDHELSNVTFLFSEEGDLLTVTELHMIKNNDGNMTVSMYVDGRSVISVDTEEIFMTVAEVRSQEVTSRNIIGSLAECLGITFQAAGVIVAGCGALCLVSAGVACLPCLGAAAGVGVGGLIGCRL